MLAELLMRGGPILWVILFLGLIALSVYIERSVHLHRARIRADDFVKGIMNVVSRGNITEALALCDDTPGPVAYVIKRMIQHRDDGQTSLHDVVRDASAAEISRMERRLVLVAIVAQISPLIGLFGTICGLYSSLAQYEIQAPLTVNVFAGLRMALITTGGGLLVAIPCYAAFNALVVKIDRLVLDIEKAASEMMAFLPSRGADTTEGR